ncbi:unnamed protein product [Candidula unifasciata]|uniref:Uncharacterized protein n=1 Tax=Candidula unifasciata TaxID=100452 RepID=A0A8S3ZYT0_9EUPU|nr:unnamed protein product [Candidula unifasciata]
MIFENKTAWFSESCPDNVKKLWVDNGGKLEDVTLSQYVFSDDWQHEDTNILYNSEAYLKQHLAIFSSQYIPDALHQGIDNVSLGKYFLIPGPIKDCINFRSLQTSLVAQNNNVAGVSPKHAQQIPSSSNQQINKQRKDGDSSSSSTVSSSAGMSSAVTVQIPQQAVSSDTIKVVTSHTTARKVANAETNSHSLYKNRCSDISQINLESIPHVQSLPKVISCLQTIHPGRDGVKVVNKT